MPLRARLSASMRSELFGPGSMRELPSRSVGPEPACSSTTGTLPDALGSNSVPYKTPPATASETACSAKACCAGSDGAASASAANDNNMSSKNWRRSATAKPVRITVLSKIRGTKNSAELPGALQALVEHQRIQHRYHGPADAQRQQQPVRRAGGDGQQTGDAAGHHQLRRQPMRRVPDAVAGQRPRRAHADEKIAPHFAQRVTDQNQQHEQAARQRAR